MKDYHKPMKMTPRRKEILWHIAYTDEIKWCLGPDWRWKPWQNNAQIKMPRLRETDVNGTLIELKRFGMVKYNFYAQRVMITPHGMEALLATVH